MLRNCDDPMRCLALKVMDQTYRDVVAITGEFGPRQFQPGVTTESAELQEEKDKLIDFLLVSTPMPGTVFWWGAHAGMKEDEIEEFREALLDALDEHDDYEG